MVSFVKLRAIPQIIILTLFLILLLINGHIMAFTILRTRRRKISVIAAFHMLLYYIVLISLATFLHEADLGVEFNPVSYYLAALPIWIYQALLMIGSCFAFILLYKIKLYQKSTITKASIKESIDNLPAGLCISLENSFIILSNWQMDRLCHILTGQTLQSVEIFWDELTEGMLKEGNKRWPETINPIITLADSRTWSFARDIIEIGNQSVIEIIAIDITDLNALRIQLEKNNRILTEMGSRLRQYSINVMEVKAKEERLATKMRIHDEIGYALLATRQFFRGQKSEVETESQTEKILDIWSKNISSLHGAPISEPSSALDSLNSAAKAIGVRVFLQGELPKDSNITNLILLAAGECLTNSVRHAHATELYLKLAETSKYYIATFSNNGDLPIAEIIEGGGLSGIRHKVEAMGGVMEVTHMPRFLLKITILRKGNEGDIVLWPL